MEKLCKGCHLQRVCFDWKGKVAKIASHMKFIHCITHRQDIAAKKLESEVL